MEEIVEWILKVLGARLHEYVSVCAMQQSPSPSEIFFSFIMIVFVYSLSIAFSSSYVGSGDQLQLSVIALFVVACIYPYLVT